MSQPSPTMVTIRTRLAGVVGGLREALGRAGRWPAAAGLVALAVFSLTALHARDTRIMSPYDEAQHLDYAVKVGNFDLPGDDERYGEVAMRETACRGIDTPGLIVPPCDAPVLEPEWFPDYGYNTAASALPAYYFPTGLLARAIVATTPVESPLLSVRIVGAVWLALGLVLMLALMRELGARLESAVPIALLLATTPVVVNASSFATTDSMLVLCSSALLYSVLLWQRGRIRLWVPALVAVFAMAVDLANIIALFIAWLLIAHPVVADLVPERGVEPVEPASPEVATARRRQLGIWSAVTAVSIVLAERGFEQVRIWVTGESGRITVDLPRFGWQQRPPFGWDVVLGSYRNLVSPVRDGHLPQIMRALPYPSLTATLNWLLIAGALGAAAWAIAHSRTRSFAMATSIALLASAPLLTTAMWLRGGLFFHYPPRYGLALIPALGVTLALSAGRRSLSILLALLAAAQVFLFTFRLLG